MDYERARASVTKGDSTVCEIVARLLSCTAKMKIHGELYTGFRIDSRDFVNETVLNSVHHRFDRRVIYPEMFARTGCGSI